MAALFAMDLLFIVYYDKIQFSAIFNDNNFKATRYARRIARAFEKGESLCRTTVC